MYIGLGQDVLISDKSIIGIFDLDNTTVSKSTREYINTASKKGECVTVSMQELPKSFVVACENGARQVYISPFNTSTVIKRLRQKAPVFRNK